MASTHASVMTRLGRICAALPEATEGITVHHPSLKIRNKAFVMYVDTRDDGRPALWIKAGPGVLDEMVAIDGERFFKPPYVGPRGWVGVRLDTGVDWTEITELVTDAYRLSAPKGLVARLDAATS